MIERTKLQSVIETGIQSASIVVLMYNTITAIRGIYFLIDEGLEVWENRKNKPEDGLKLVK